MTKLEKIESIVRKHGVSMDVANEIINIVDESENVSYPCNSHIPITRSKYETIIESEFVKIHRVLKPELLKKRLSRATGENEELISKTLFFREMYPDLHRNTVSYWIQMGIITPEAYTDIENLTEEEVAYSRGVYEDE